jgi:rhodanese-related sulfurtransferase
MEFNMGHIPGSILLDISSADFIDRVSRLDKTRHYYVYCQSGSRSMHACRLMQKHGIERTYNLARGVMTWRGELVAPHYTSRV